MAILAKPGTWALSLIVVDDGGGFTTAAMEQRLAPTVENYYPPMLADYSGYTLPVALVRLVGAVGTPDASTWLLPPLTTTLRQLSAAQRNAARSLLDNRLTGYTFRDWDGRDVVKAAWRSADLSLGSPISAIVTLIFEHLAHSEYRPKPNPPESHNTEHSDTFDSDSSANWTNDGASAYSRNATDGELQQSNWDNDARLRYSAATPGSIEHEAQATYKVISAVRSVLSGARMYGTGDDAYGAWTAGGDSNLQVARFNASVRTALTTHTLSPALDANDWGTFRIACSGAAGANVVINHWVQDHGATKPSDPGWIGTDGSPTYTQTDTAADRLDDTTHTSTGFAGRGAVNADTVRRMDFWKSRAISDRGGGGSTYDVAVSEAATAADSVASAGVLAAALSEAASAADTVAAMLAAAAALAESATATDSVSGALVGSAALSEAAAATDSISAALIAAGVLAESGSASDTLASLAVLIGALSESATATDSLSAPPAGATYDVSISEAAAAVDALTAALTRVGALSEAGAASDSLTASLAIVAQLVETGSAADSIVAALVASGALSEAGTATDSVASLAILQAAVVEAGSAIDALAAAGVLSVSIVETAAATDSVTAGGQLIASAERVIEVRFTDRTVRVDASGRVISVTAATRTIN